MTKGKISGFQLFSILFVCRLTALFTFIVPQKEDFGASDKVLFTVPFYLFCLIAAAAVFLATAKGTHDIFASTQTVSPLLTKGISVFYTAVFLWTAAISTARFELFISTVMYPDSNTALLTAMLLTAAAAAAVRGPETVGRTAVILFFLLIGSLILILGSTVGEFDAVNMTVPLENGLSPVLKNALHSASRTAEIASAAAAAGFTCGGIKKSVLSALTAFSAAAAVIFLLIGGVTGLYGEQQMFQLYTMTVIAKFGVFERMDAMLTGFWVLCSFLKSAYYIMLAVISVQRGFGVKCGRGVYFIFAAAVFAAYRTASGTTAVFSEVISSPVIEITFVLSCIVIPLTVFFAGKATERKIKKDGGKITV